MNRRIGFLPYPRVFVCKWMKMGFELCSPIPQTEPISDIRMRILKTDFLRWKDWCNAIFLHIFFLLGYFSQTLSYICLMSEVVACAWLASLVSFKPRYYACTKNSRDVFRGRHLHARNKRCETNFIDWRHDYLCFTLYLNLIGVDRLAYYPVHSPSLFFEQE